jgi:hypothetical protein
VYIFYISNFFNNELTFFLFQQYTKIDELPVGLDTIVASIDLFVNLVGLLQIVNPQ